MDSVIHKLCFCITFQTYAKGLSAADCQVKYLALANQCLLYGCSKFYAHYKGNWEFGSEIVIAINYTGVKLISVHEKTIACDLKYDDIEMIWFDKSADQLVFILTDNAQCAQKCYMFDCRDCIELISLLKQYHPNIDNHILEQHKGNSVESEVMYKMTVFI